MFEHLARWSKILVTGPQRSGTTIASQMIAADTGHRCVDEDDFRVSDLRLFSAILRGSKGIVAQCPALCRYVHELADADTLVVLMRRPLGEILRSQRRIRWDKNEREELARYGTTVGPIARVKYDFWEREQKPILGERAIEIMHASLEGHPLWVPAEKRRRFRPKQTAAVNASVAPTNM